MSQVKANSFTDASGGSNAVLYGVAAPANSMGFRNRIINGDMRIDQRNAGASVTPSTSAYILDRWKLNPSQASKITVQQTPSATETGYATRVAAGFSSYLGCTVASAATVGAADYFQLSQTVEGLNISDLAWGTSSAQSITLSFWVYSSLTGTFGGSLSNSGQAVGYAFNYSIPSANTWTKITLTIPGPTTGTWLTTNGIGILAIFNLGCGSNYFGTANTWLTQAYINSPSGCVNVVATAGATFYITGVQLEAGSVASPFERRDYGRELMMCQRYLPVWNSSGNPSFVGHVAAQTSTSVFCTVPFLVTPRVAPTGILVSAASHFQVVVGAAGPIPSAITFNQGSYSAGLVNATVTGLTTGTAGIIYATTTAAQIQFTGCEL